MLEKTGAPQRPRLLKVDPAAEWEKHKAIFVGRAELASATPPERYRMLAFADYTRREVDTVLHMAPREFIIPLAVGDPAQGYELQIYPSEPDKT